MTVFHLSDISVSCPMVILALAAANGEIAAADSLESYFLTIKNIGIYQVH